MANVVVVGAQWGDEGKGKIVDWLSERADVVVRFQGGHNAGHTLVIDGAVYKLSLLPSGIVRPGKLSLIGNGVVIDPWALAAEIDTLTAQGVAVDRDNLRIAENAPLILPLHRDLDQLREDAAGAGRIGTTGRGIGPAYEDKAGRRAIRVFDLQNPETLGPKIERLLTHHNALRRGLGVAEVDGAALKTALDRDRAAPAALHGFGLGASRPGAPGRAAHPVRGCARRHARHRSRHLSRSSPRPTPSPPRPPPAQAWGRAPSPMCWASPRPMPRGSAPGRSRPSRPTRSASARRARPRVRHRDRPQAPLRLVRCRAGAPGHQDLGHQRYCADQARCPGRLR
jgi:hypothetical protein